MIMNLFNTALNFVKSAETYNIVECSSEIETDKDEISDTSSPECSEKKTLISTLQDPSLNKNKLSVVRNILNNKPILDIHLSQKKIKSLNNEGSHGIKRKRVSLSTNEIKILKRSDLQTFESIEKKLKGSYSFESVLSLQEESSRGDDQVSNFNKLEEDSRKLCSAMTVKLNKSSSPEIFSDYEDSEDKVNYYGHNEEIICSQDSSFQILSKNDEYLKNIEELNESLSSQKTLCVEDVKEYSDCYDNKEEEIIFSQDSFLNIPSTNGKLNSDKVEKFIESLSRSELFDEEGKIEEEINFDGTEIEECSALCEKSMDVSMKSSTDSLKNGFLSEKVNNEEPILGEHKPKCDVLVHTQNQKSNFVKTNFGIKLYKKGSLLQRASHVISDLRKEANLFTHEIKVGLRLSKGLLVSEPILVTNIYYEDRNYIVSCTPQDLSGVKHQFHVKKNVHLILSKLPAEMGINSIVVIHFPLVALLGLPSMSVILFAENRVQHISVNKCSTHSCSINNSLFFKGMAEPKDHKLMRVIRKKENKNILDTIVSQLLGNYCLLELRLLHLFEKRTGNNTTIELLAVDSENQFCLIRDDEYIQLNGLHIEVGNLYMFFEFRLMKCLRVNDEIKSAAEYYSELKFCSDFIYIVQPCNDSWKINFIKKISSNPLGCTSLNSVKVNNMTKKRFKQLVKECKVFENKVFVRDESLSELMELHFDELCKEEKMKFNTLSMPFILNGIYYLNGCLCYDKYSKLIFH